MAGRKIRDAADARQSISAASSAGQSLGEWASEHGVDGRSLHSWWLNLSGRRGQMPKASESLRLVELVPERAAVNSRFTVRVGTVSVDVDANFDEAALRRLLAVVGSC
jgi:hypothetical protein